MNERCAVFGQRATVNIIRIEITNRYSRSRKPLTANRYVQPNRPAQFKTSSYFGPGPFKMGCANGFLFCAAVIVMVLPASFRPIRKGSVCMCALLFGLFGPVLAL